MYSAIDHEHQVARRKFRDQTLDDRNRRIRGIAYTENDLRMGIRVWSEVSEPM